MEDRYGSFIKSLFAGWDTTVEVPHDGVDTSLLPSGSAENTSGMGVVGTEARSLPSAFSDDIISPENPQKWDFSTRKHIQKLRGVGLNSDTYFVILDHYQCHDALESYLSKMDEAQRALCLELKQAIRDKVNQRNCRARKSREIQMLKAKKDDLRAELTNSRERLQCTRDAVCYAKVDLCDLLLDIGRQAAENGVKLPEWIHDI